MTADAILIHVAAAMRIGTQAKLNAGSTGDWPLAAYYARMAATSARLAIEQGLFTFALREAFWCGNMAVAYTKLGIYAADYARQAVTELRRACTPG